MTIIGPGIDVVKHSSERPFGIAGHFVTGKQDYAALREGQAERVPRQSSRAQQKNAREVSASRAIIHLTGASAR